MGSESRWALWLEPILPVPRLVALARRAEELGASHVVVADEGTDRDLYVTLTAIALATESVQLVAGITNPFSRHPVTTAAAFATLAELAPGRIVAGLGTGGSRVLGPIGVTPSRPYAALRETVDVVGRLLSGEEVTHEGEFRAEGAVIPWSSSPLPIAIAGRGPRMQRLAGEVADWTLLAGTALDRVGAVCDRLRAAERAGGAVAIGWSSFLAWTPGLIDAIRPHFTYITADLPPKERQAAGVDDALAEQIREVMLAHGTAAAAQHVPIEVLERYALVGDRADVVAALAEVRGRVRPEPFVLPVSDYGAPEEFLEQAATLIVEAGFASADHPPLRHPKRNGETMSSWIATIPPEKATGLLAEAYERQARSLGRPTAFTELGSLDPELVHARLALYRASERCPSPLTPRQRAVVAYVTSVVNETPHCASQVRLKLYQLGFSHDLLAALDAGRYEALPAHEAAVARFAQKLTLQPGAVAEDDIAALRHAGLGDLEILDANNMCAHLNYVNRVSNGLGLRTEVDATFQPFAAIPAT